MDGRISWLRIVACYLTILLHIAAPHAELQTSGWTVAILIDSLTRVCVPIFFMISGATLLTKSEPLGEFFHKRLLRIVPPLLFWSTVYLLGAVFVGTVNRPLPSGFVDGAVAVIKGPVSSHLWYLYAILGMYTAIPMLRRFYQNATQMEKFWALGAWFIGSACLPMLNSAMAPTTCADPHASTFDASYQLTIYANYLGYFLLGAIVAEGGGNRRVGILAFIIGSMATFSGVMWHSKMANGPCLIFLSYTSPFVVMAAAGMFAFIYSWRKEHSTTVKRAAECTLGIYCIHYIFIREIFVKLDMNVGDTSVWITAPFIALMAFILSGIVIYGMRFTRLGRFVT
jgi:surface polysaccharide O-acyltransferase-like enzyme